MASSNLQELINRKTSNNTITEIFILILIIFIFFLWNHIYWFFHKGTSTFFYCLLSTGILYNLMRVHPFYTWHGLFLHICYLSTDEWNLRKRQHDQDLRVQRPLKLQQCVQGWDQLFLKMRILGTSNNCKPGNNYMSYLIPYMSMNAR